MSDTVITVDSISKCYRIGLKDQRHRTFREMLMDTVMTPVERWRLRGGGMRPEEEFWALKDVSFEVKRGEVVGIIGRNGAGKSTLLKILSRITEPTKGEIRLRGRVASLLEVGTGFHPELTGRENIFLNGAILGMKRAEIARKFDEIVAFAEIEKFLDTPVKRYSSGMYVRLAFAVAAHLEPEILIVDEVLAVGDVEFQKKCLGKMKEVAEGGGRTVLFVSHNMQAVQSLCSAAVWLSKGSIHKTGTAEEITDSYLRTSASRAGPDIASAIRALPDDPTFRLESVTVLQENVCTTHWASSKPVRLEAVYEVKQRVSGLRLIIELCDESEDVLIRTFHDENDTCPAEFSPGRYASVAEIPANLLAPRTYCVRISAGIHNVRICTPTPVIIPVCVLATGRINRAYAGDPVRSKLQPIIEWRTVAR